VKTWQVTLATCFDPHRAHGGCGNVMT